MSFPPSLTTRTVKGRFVTHPDGTPAKGFVRIVLNDYMQGPADDMFVAPFDREIQLDSNGAFSTILPATDDPNWTPSFYKVVISTLKKDVSNRIIGPADNAVVRGRFNVPYNATDDLDLADILNLPPVLPAQNYILAAAKGVPGGVASLGADGLVPTSQLPVSSGGGAVDWTAVQNKPATFPPSAHTHAQADVTGLTTSLAGKANAVHTHSTSDIASLDTALASKATVTDLTTGLAGKANTVHTHATSDVTGLDTALSTKADASALSSKADLVGGVLPTSQLPSIAVIDFLGSVASQTAMLALTGQKGDWCLRTDLGQHWIITGSDPTQLTSWTAIPLPTVPVQTVNGQTGAVVLGKADIGLSNVDNTSDANKPVSTAQQTALNLKAPLANPSFTGTVSGVTAAMVGLGNVDNTSDVNKPISTATQTALDAKAPLASPALTGVPTAPTAASSTSTTQIATTAFVHAYTLPAILLGPADAVPGGTPTNTLIFRTA